MPRNPQSGFGSPICIVLMGGLRSFNPIRIGRERKPVSSAIEIAHQQEARILELRAATNLARMWRDAGSSNDLRVLLEPILATIEGGDTTRDVRNARALLVEIG